MPAPQNVGIRGKFRAGPPLPAPLIGAAPQTPFATYNVLPNKEEAAKGLRHTKKSSVCALFASIVFLAFSKRGLSVSLSHLPWGQIHWLPGGLDKKASKSSKKWFV